MFLDLNHGAVIFLRKEELNVTQIRKPKDSLCGNPRLLFCVNPVSPFPEDEIAEELKSGGPLLNLFEKEEEWSTVVKRDVGEYEESCPSTTFHWTPRIATNSNNQQEFLVNHVNGLVQTVEVNLCDSEPGESCQGNIDRPSKCQQKYLKHKLVVYNQETGKLFVDTFSFPSCCECMLQRNWGL